ncbi:F-box/FBD/LRR-repeat protein-like protein [Tanacetum coccineum]
MDWFNNLLPGIIEIILCFLLIQEAVRTSILSREWRYHWIKIPKLEFEELNFHVSTDGAESSNGAECDQSQKRKDLIKRRKFFYAICLSFVNARGSIMKNTIKKLAIDNEWGWYKLPVSVFSFHHLADLRLGGCAFSHLPTFNEFGSLTSLSLGAVHISIKELLHLLSNCPSLKTMTMINNLSIEEGKSSFEEDNLLKEDDICSFTLSDYSDIWLEDMSELYITSHLIFGSELNFVKLILAKPPVLKKVTIRLDYRKFGEDEELQILQVLLSSPRASPVVEIII